MTDTDTTTKNTVDSALDAGKQLAGVGPRVTFLAHPDRSDIKIPLALQGDGESTSVDVLTGALELLDKRLAGPRRRTGTTRLFELDSLIAYVKRYASAHTMAFANTSEMAIVVVFDDHPAGPDQQLAHWREHRAAYSCPRSPEWIAWTAQEGKNLRQEEFADFLEARLEDLVVGEGFPKPTDVLMVARQLHIKTKGTFQREINPTNGDHVLVAKTETDASSTQIPRAFMLGIPVFEGGERYSVEARIRFALLEGRPVFSYTMHRRREIERDAFNGIRLFLSANTAIPVLAGTP